MNTDSGTDSMAPGPKTVVRPLDDARSIPLPDRIVDRLVGDIYRGVFAVGEHLPPMRSLASQLGVDVTSLRMALERLKQMDIVRTIQGSGVTVLDIREAGIGYLASVFALPSAPDDTGLLLQLMDFQSSVAPGLLEAAARRATPKMLDDFDALLAAQLAAGDDFDALVEAVLATEDAVAEVADNLIVSMVYNSTRSLRRALIRRVYRDLDVAAQVEPQRAWLMAFGEDPEQLGELVEAYRSFQPMFTGAARAILLAELYGR
jgi:DNA-binding FadR family transcriptional regulator